MKKTTVILLIAAACLVLFGCAGFSLAMAANHWDFTALESEKMKTSTFDLAEDFRDISIRSDTEEILFLPSDDGKCKVVCYEQEKKTYTVSAERGTLSIESADSRNWYEHLAVISFEAPAITLYLPKNQYAALSIEGETGNITIPNNFLFESMDISLSTGDVDCRASASGAIRIKDETGSLDLQGLSAGEIELSASTGKVEVKSVACKGSVGVTADTGKVRLTDVSCKSLRSSGDTGGIILKNVLAAETITVQSSTGGVRLERCDANELMIETDTGRVDGLLLTDKVFITETDTGRVRVPKTMTGGRCEIKTDTGDITMEIAEE